MQALLRIESEKEEERPGWWASAVCNDGDATMTALFFSEELVDIIAAKAICDGCAVREQCLRGALERGEPWGVWGGQLLLNGKILAQKRRRGRPRKHPRPEDMIVQTA